MNMKQADYKDTYFYLEWAGYSKKGSLLTKQEKIKLGLEKQQPATKRVGRPKKTE